MKNAVFACDLDDRWLKQFKGVKVLSLDCFDTIFWRKVAKPVDVFFSLQNTAAFSKLGITATIRGRAETKARRKMQLLRQSSEVSFEDIYREILPEANNELISSLVDEEIQCEILHGFIFEPVARLIRQAKASGLKVVVVSDTYFSEPQLKKLLFSILPELEPLIDRIYCSSVIGKSKTGGIWPTVLAKQKVKPCQICHLGDNEMADLKAPAQYGIAATHLRQQSAQIEALLEQRESAALQLLPEIRHSYPLPSYFHAQLAVSGQVDYSRPVEQIGYAVLGPLLYAFAQFIVDEVHALEAMGKSVKVGFLLRDGYMPLKAVETIRSDSFGTELNISRFTAIAASLDSRQAIVDILANSLTKESIPALSKQFLLPSVVADNLREKVGNSPSPESEFRKFILRDETVAQIIDASFAYRQRLIKHIQKQTGIQRGETLMFVDLGYSGTAQNQLRRILKTDMGVDLVGRYLIASKVFSDQSDRRGMVDPSWADERLVVALTQYIAVFEMMCTLDGPSTEGFTSNGEPVFASDESRVNQGGVVKEIQLNALKFISDYVALPAAYRPQLNVCDLSHGVVAELARLIYFPMAEEIDCLKQFDFDMNMGTDLKFALADLERSASEMRREGFAYMNKTFTNQRTNYPMELRYEDLSLSTLLLSVQRYGYGIRTARMSYRKEVLPIIASYGSEHVTNTAEAFATVDGYFSLQIPSSEKFNIAVLLGQAYEYIQFECLQNVSLNDLRQMSELRIGEDAIFDGVLEINHDLIKFDSSGMVFFPAIPGGQPNHMRRLVYRPIVRRDALSE